MTFEQAYERVALAGRELGSGPLVAALVLDPDYEANVAKMVVRKVPQLNAECIMLGTVIGRVMAEESAVMARLDNIAIERYGAGRD